MENLENVNKPGRSIIFINYNKENKYSWASLVGALEESGIFYSGGLILETMNGEASMEKCLHDLSTGKIEHLHVLISTPSSNAGEDIAFIQRVRDKAMNHGLNSCVTIISGGPHASARPLDMLNAGADAVVMGEGEESIIKFFESVMQHDGKNDDGIPSVMEILADVPNCCFRVPGEVGVKRTRVKQTKTLDTCPALASNHRMFRPVEITRGCPHGCYFCQTSYLFGRKRRHRTIKNTVKWVKKAVRLKFDKLWFTTPDAFSYLMKGKQVNVKGITTLLKELSRIPGLEQIFFGTFPSEVRPEHVTQEVIDGIAPFIANRRFIVGAQSASPELLKKTHRGHTVADIWNAIDIITSSGFKIDLDFIFGLPGELKEDVIENMDFLNEILKNKRVRIHSHVFMPLPGTPFENEKPGTLDGELESKLGTFAKNGRLYGARHLEEKSSDL
ncbi:TIGR04013 family B12-binding domain/radical SAM domain-containing protein [Candidatus Bathyarchaeota archaeon]|nr:TIGR04013 family B12-binding domain/radical SAM domain-containing protein [Candidatus Bathyarchaeota archaeon]